MAGTWVAQNKVRPDFYLNMESEEKALGSIGDRGTTALALSLPWGESKSIIPLVASEDFFSKLGYDITAPSMLLIKEAFKRARTVLLYRLNSGTKAAVTIGTLVATAKHGGVRGNNITIKISANIDDNTKFDVSTLVDNQVIETQTVSGISGLVSNAWVVFSGTGTITATAGAPLTGGADGTVTNADHTAFLSALELQPFQTVGLVSSDAALKSVYVSFIKRLREDNGRKVQAVIENYPAADYEGIISVKNGVTLTDGTILSAAQAVAWVAGATAGAAANQGLTGTAYEEAIDANPRYTDAQITAALLNGEFVFTYDNGRVVVEQDINTFRSYTPKKRKHFSKNRPLRALDGLANDWKNAFNAYYKGKVDNDPDGRTLYKSELVKIAGIYQDMRAIQNFVADDITIVLGDEADAVLVEGWIQPTDAIEKSYMKVRVR
ncbi:phage tail sheath family protein [Paenibacillus shunpengii]|uniref:Phage tail sheath family protein n=1 Tax=Paenibacillus shunpengii TaxID=2054424 RepID=A0ABW5SW53_9BACL